MYPFFLQKIHELGAEGTNGGFMINMDTSTVSAAESELPLRLYSIGKIFSVALTVLTVLYQLTHRLSPPGPTQWASILPHLRRLTTGRN